MKQETKNVLIAGVGGQGVLLVSEMLALAYLKAGYDVKKSEVHGMAQRGGSVVSHVRFGSQVHSPLIEKGTAHVLLALEELEALRWSDYLHPDGIIIVNRQQIKPMPVAVGSHEYPTKILSRLEKKTSRTVSLDGVKLASQSGHFRTVNIVMLGALAAHLDLDPNELRNIIRTRLPKKSIPANLKAFDMGWKVLAEAKKT